MNVDRDTPMLLPCDLRDWVKDNDFTAFVLEAVETTDLRGAHVTNQPGDRQEFEPNLNNLNPAHLKEVRFVAVDKGYYNRRGLIDLEKSYNVRILAPPIHQDRKEKKRYAADHPREIEKRYKEKLLRRLKTNQGQTIYRKRNIFSEGAFATIKTVIIFKRFRLKGLAGV